MTFIRDIKWTYRWQSIIWHFGYVLSTFSLHLKINKMRVRGVVSRLKNILYCFHSSRNAVLSYIMQLHRCFECFCSEESCKSTNQDIKWRIKDEELKIKVLQRLLKTIQSEENSFQVPRSFQTKERSKMRLKRKKSPLRLSCAPLWLIPGKNHFLLVFQAGSVDKAQFSSLNPKVTYCYK